MKSNKASISAVAEKCKNILASNWQGRLNTIKADAKDSKAEIYSSKVSYMIKKGKPYFWIPEKDLHNVNTIIDERGSFSVASPYPGPLANLLRSMKKLPTRIALTGDVVPLRDAKFQFAEESLREMILSEQKAMSKFSYSVSAILSSSGPSCALRSEKLQELLDGGEQYMVYKFNLSSCMLIDGDGGTHEVNLEDIEASKADILSPFSANIIDGINQSEVRRRALLLFCFVYKNANAKDAYVLSIDRKGFVVLGKVPSPQVKDGSGGWQWKEFRFTFKEEAHSVEGFCIQLVDMEEEALKNVSSYSGLRS